MHFTETQSFDMNADFSYGRKMMVDSDSSISSLESTPRMPTPQDCSRPVRGPTPPRRLVPSAKPVSPRRPVFPIAPHPPHGQQQYMAHPPMVPKPPSLPRPTADGHRPYRRPAASRYNYPSPDGISEEHDAPKGLQASPHPPATCTPPTQSFVPRPPSASRPPGAQRSFRRADKARLQASVSSTGLHHTAAGLTPGAQNTAPVEVPLGDVKVERRYFNTSYMSDTPRSPAQQCSNTEEAAKAGEYFQDRTEENPIWPGLQTALGRIIRPEDVVKARTARIDAQRRVIHELEDNLRLQAEYWADLPDTATKEEKVIRQQAIAMGKRLGSCAVSCEDIPHPPRRPPVEFLDDREIEALQAYDELVGKTDELREEVSIALEINDAMEDRVRHLKTELSDPRCFTEPPPSITHPPPEQKKKKKKAKKEKGKENQEKINTYIAEEESKLAPLKNPRPPQEKRTGDKWSRRFLALFKKKGK